MKNQGWPIDSTKEASQKSLIDTEAALWHIKTRENYIHAVSHSHLLSNINFRATGGKEAAFFSHTNTPSEREPVARVTLSPKSTICHPYNIDPNCYLVKPIHCKDVDLNTYPVKTFWIEQKIHSKKN